MSLTWLASHPMQIYAGKSLHAERAKNVFYGTSGNRARVQAGPNNLTKKPQGNVNLEMIKEFKNRCCQKMAKYKKQMLAKETAKQEGKCIPVTMKG